MVPGTQAGDNGSGASIAPFTARVLEISAYLRDVMVSPRRVACVAAVLVLLASPGAVAAEKPPNSAGNYRERVVTRDEDGVRVSVAVLSTREAHSEYGVLLARRSIQPVWIEVENRTSHTLWLMSPGIDPGFFPASEAAEAFERPERRFRELSFPNPVAPASTASGFVLTNLHEGVKFVQLDLVGEKWSKTYLMLTPVPGLRSDYLRSRVFLEDNYSASELVHFDDDASFRAALEALPCCVTNKDGTKNGDPLNLVIVGGLDDAFPALVRRGWSPTESTWSGSVMRMINSALAKERYAYAPISSLYLYGRPQDVALQKARDNVHQRNHLRLWKSPMRYRGKTVWVGQISRDIGSRMTIHSPTLTTHKIDPDVDGAALALAGDMVYSQNLQKIGFAGGVGPAAREAPKRNLTTDPYFTVGLRTVLIFDRKPTSITDIEILPWELTLDRAADDPATVQR